MMVSQRRSDIEILYVYSNILKKDIFIPQLQRSLQINHNTIDNTGHGAKVRTITVTYNVDSTIKVSL